MFNSDKNTKDETNADSRKQTFEPLRPNADDSVMADGAVSDTNPINSEISSRALLKSIFRASPTAIGTIRNRVFISVNEKMCQMTGYRKDELIGKKTRKLYPTIEDYDYVGSEKYDQIRNTGTGTVEAKWQTKDGKILDILLSSTPLSLGGDELDVVFTAMDITASKETERSLFEYAEMAKAMMNATTDAVAILDAEGFIVDLNEEYAKRFGLKAEQMRGTLSTGYMPSDIKAKRTELFMKVLDTGKLVHGEDCRDGIWNDYVMYPFNDASGKLNRVAVFGRDITRRKRAEEAVRSEHYQFISMFNGMDEIAYVADPKTYKLLYLNKFTKDCWGGEVGQKCYDVLHGLDKPCFFCSNKVILKQKNAPYIWEFYNKKNERWYHCIDRAISWHGDSIVHFELAIDITVQKKAENNIWINEAKFKNLFQYTRSGGAIYEAVEDGKNFIFKDFNRAAEKIDKISREKVLGQKITNIFPAVEEFGLLDVLKRVWETGTPEHLPLTLYKDDREWGWRENYIYKLQSGEIVVIYDDVTERKQYEEKILANQKQLNDLAIELSLAEERERRRLAIELHDQIGQLLVISKMKTDSVKKNAENDTIKKAMDEVSCMLHKAIDDTKTLTFDLSCPMLYELGFEKAIAGYLLDEAKKYGLETEFISDGQAEKIDDNIGVLLFRHIKELLFNVVKHAKATKVTITSIRQNDMLEIEVADNGIGFDVSKVAAKLTKNKGFGLFSIRERLGQIGGDLEIVSDANSGTSVTILAPMKK